jgi:coatomer subunit beta
LASYPWFQKRYKIEHLFKLIICKSDEEKEKEQKEKEQKEAPKKEPTKSSVVRVLADGTYATQSALTESSSTSTASKAPSVPHLRALLLGGDFFLGSVLSATLTKLALKSIDQEIEQVTKNMVVVYVCQAFFKN